MELHLSPAERHALRELQGRCRERADYVPVTVVLLLDKGRSVPSIADDLGVSVATVYRYAALNAVVATELYLDETDCVNAQSTRRLYEQLLQAHPKALATSSATTPATTKTRRSLPGWPTHA